MIVDNVWKLTNTVRVGLDARSSHAKRQSTFPDNVCSYCPPCHGVLHYENLTTFLFFSKVQQVPNDTDPLMWWKQHQQEFPDLARMARQYLAVPATSASPERFFSRVGLVQTDLRGSLLDTTMIDLMWAKQAP